MVACFVCQAVIGVAGAKTDRLSFCDFLDAICRIAYYLAPFQPVEGVLVLMLTHVFFEVRISFYMLVSNWCFSGSSVISV